MPPQLEVLVPLKVLLLNKHLELDQGHLIRQLLLKLIGKDLRLQ